MIHHFFQSSMILQDHQYRLQMTYQQFLNGFTNGKSYSTQISQNRPKRLLFSGKAIATYHVTVYFNNVPVIREKFEKHFGLFLDFKLNFFDHQ